MTNKIIAPVRGTRDFYPKEMAFQTWFYNQAKEVAESFGFQEYDGPIIETLDLYAAKSGEELVKRQSFTLKGLSGKILALRPEMTPTLARMVAQKAGDLVFPVKWFNYGRRFRYEKPQKGRGREFFQWDVDILGSELLEADAEVISVAAAFYQKLGLTPQEVKIKINDRQLLESALENISIAKKQTRPIFKIIDKKNKVSDKVFQEMLQEKKLSQKQISSLLKILADKKLYLKSPWLKKIYQLIEKMGLDKFVEFDATIVRGLDYYTRTVFEGWATKGELRAIWGGGRYDNLTQEVGGKIKIPGVGFAMGDMVMAELLKKLNKYPKLNPNSTKVLVTVFSPELEAESIKITNQLRKIGVNTEIYLDPKKKLDKQLKYADKKNIPYAIIIGPKEVKKGQVTIKNLRTKTQKIIPQSALLKEIDLW